MNTTEKYVVDILQGIEKAFSTYDIAPPYERYPFYEGFTGYLEINQRIHNKIEICFRENDLFGDGIVQVDGLQDLSQKDIEDVLKQLKEKITEMFFDKSSLGRFRYDLITCLIFKKAEQCFYLIDELRRAELKMRLYFYIEDTLANPNKEIMPQREWFYLLDRLFDEYLGLYTKKEVLEIADKLMERITATQTEWLSGYQCMLDDNKNNYLCTEF